MYVLLLLPCAQLTKSSNFRISFGKDYTIQCTASTLDHDLNGLSGQEMFVEEYPSAVSLMGWAEGVIQKISGYS
jgi:hypothetical protein